MKASNHTNVLKAHLSLNVRDIQASINFYRNMLGIEPAKIRPGYAKFDVTNPPLNLTMNETGIDSSRRSALSHLGLQVASTADVAAMRDRWKASGLHPLDEMQTNCCFALQDKAWVSDPDGNRWEVFTVLADVESSNGACCGTSAAEDGKLVAITL